MTDYTLFSLVLLKYQRADALLLRLKDIRTTISQPQTLPEARRIFSSELVASILLRLSALIPRHAIIETNTRPSSPCPGKDSPECAEGKRAVSVRRPDSMTLSTISAPCARSPLTRRRPRNERRGKLGRQVHSELTGSSRAKVYSRFAGAWDVLYCALLCFLGIVLM